MALRRIAFGPEAESTPVIECGYMNSAIAEPSARVMNGQICCGCRIRPVAAGLPAAMAASFFAWKTVAAASKIAP